MFFVFVFFYAYLTGGDSKALSFLSGDGVGVLQIEGTIDDSRERDERTKAIQGGALD